MSIHVQNSIKIIPKHDPDRKNWDRDPDPDSIWKTFCDPIAIARSFERSSFFFSDNEKMVEYCWDSLV